MMGVVKYAIMPQHLKEEELIFGNSLLSAGHFLSILLANLFASTMVGIPKSGIIVTMIVVLILSFLGILASRKIPLAIAKDPELKFNYNFLKDASKIFVYCYNHPKGILLTLGGIAWFYFVSSVFMSQIQNFVKFTLNANTSVLTTFYLVFSIGVACGSIFNSYLLKNRPSTIYVPLASLLISFFIFDITYSSKFFYENPSVLMLSFNDFFSTFYGIRIILDMFFLAISAGLFVVPLNIMIQVLADSVKLGRVLSVSTFLTAVAMCLSSLFCYVLLVNEFKIVDIFYATAVLNLLISIYICRLLPDKLVKSFLQVLLKFLYKVNVKGLSNYTSVGKKSVIVCNHVSYLDALILAAFLPGRPIFAMNTNIANKWWVKPWMNFAEIYKIDSTNTFSMKEMISRVKSGKHLVIFPEGRLTETGSLMKIYEGPGMIAYKANAPIVPIRLDGLQHTPFSRLRGKVPALNFPRVSMTILEPFKIELDENLSSRKQRDIASKKLFHLMEHMAYDTDDKNQTIYEALLKSQYVNGDKFPACEDIQWSPLTVKKLIRSSVVLGRKIAELTKAKDSLGLMLPNSLGGVVTYFSMLAYARVPAMINYTQGALTILKACEASKVTKIFTSRRFIKLGEFEDLIAKLEDKIEIIYLEDLKDKINFFDKMVGLFSNPQRIHEKFKVNPNEAATILFTSGTENAPKGVVLSHRNIMSNVIQMCSRIDFNNKDTMFNALPMFHSFGLICGTILPILSGVKLFLYPSPLHYKLVPEMIYGSNATILFGTDSFLNGYAKMAHPYDFHQVRYIFAGAERVKPQTRQKYIEQFGVRIFEGYGTTETAPVISVNSAIEFKNDTVGRFLPGISYKIEEVSGIAEGGRLHVKGPNVMLGYYLDSNPGKLVEPKDGWHDTGDIVSVDEDNFITIKGRAKRFAKIAGEMVSLTLVEKIAFEVDSVDHHAAVAIDDDLNGEMIVLITTNSKLNKQDIQKYIKEHDISDLHVPKAIKHISEMLLLGTGKIDYVGLNKWAKDNTK
jgi:acyl-[acyl-carrier-protein]-phospholipid O-acyltransferase/long-chain-fatty-acid--[acyl-carrier-protein] ligase